MDWRADQLQAALFPVPSTAQIDALETWRIVTGGEEPRSYQRPDVSPVSVSVAEGTVGGHRLVIQSQIGRLDLSIVPPAMNAAVANQPPAIDNLHSALENLSGIASRTVERLPIVRFGLISSLSEIHQSAEETTTRLSELCEGAWFPSPALDCVYQVNVRKNFACAPEYEMNRVATLASGTFSLTQLTANNYMNIAVPQLARVIPIINFKVDVNSASMTDISKNASKMVSEAVAESLSIISEGLRWFK